MAVSHSHGKKAPSQSPTDFYASKQQGGAYGKPSSVPDQLKSGPMRENVMGNGPANGGKNHK